MSHRLVVGRTAASVVDIGRSNQRAGCKSANTHIDHQLAHHSGEAAMRGEPNVTFTIHVTSQRALAACRTPNTAPQGAAVAWAVSACALSHGVAHSRRNQQRTTKRRQHKWLLERDPHAHSPTGPPNTRARTLTALHRKFEGCHALMFKADAQRHGTRASRPRVLPRGSFPRFRQIMPPRGVGCAHLQAGEW